MEQEPPTVMGRRRALLTDRERELIAGDNGDENRRYQAISRVRNKIQDELPTDIELLETNHAELYSELQSTVAPEEHSQRVEELQRQLEECQERLSRLRDEQEVASKGVDSSSIKKSLQAALTALSGKSPDIEMAKGELEAVVEELEEP